MNHKVKRVILNITEIKKLHQDLMRRLERQTEKKEQKWDHFRLKKEYILKQTTFEWKRNKQEIEQQSIESFKIVKDIKRLSYELNLLKRMWIHSYFMHSCFSVAIKSYHFRSLKHL
jgi:ElaB/YqjD/DUF883 family membrane-anchored ribosome-binding protein